MAVSFHVPRGIVPWILAFALGLAVAYAATGFLFLQEQETAGETITEQDGAQVQADNRERIQLIEQRNIVGLHKPPPPQKNKPKAKKPQKPAAPPPPPPPPPGPDPKDWILVGTFIGERSFALITINRENDFLFKGETRHNWKLTAVEPVKVRFEKDGQSRELLLFDESEGETRMKQGVKSQQVPPPAPQPRAEAPAPVEQGLVKGKTTRSTVDMETADEVLADPVALLKQAAFKPVDQGEVKGVRISRIQPRSLLREVGLRNNDILVSINGQSLDDPSKAADIYKNIGKTGGLEMEVVRGRRLDSIIVEIK